MAMNYETLLVTKESGITTIAFNRPEKRNAMSPQLHGEMFDLLTELRYDKETRVVVLTEHLQPKHGLYYALTGKMMSAKDAERIGLISKAVPRAELDKEVAELAKCLAEKSPMALKAVKEA